MNLWPYAAVSAAVIVFCAFIVWISPSSTQTAIAVFSILVGWWFKSPGELVQSAIETTKSKPIQTTQEAK